MGFGGLGVMGSMICNIFEVGYCPHAVTVGEYLYHCYIYIA